MFVLVRQPGKCQYRSKVKVTLKSEQIRQYCDVDANVFIQLKNKTKWCWFLFVWTSHGRVVVDGATTWNVIVKKV